MNNPKILKRCPFCNSKKIILEIEDETPPQCRSGKYYFEAWYQCNKCSCHGPLIERTADGDDDLMALEKELAIKAADAWNNGYFDFIKRDHMNENTKS